MNLPESDLALSPFTGYTRAHWEAIADRWLTHGFSHASPEGALWRIPGRHAYSGPESDALEGFARGFLLAAGRIAGGDGHDWTERFAAGLAAGTRRGGDEEWLWGVDCRRPPEGKTQPIVEAANIALALHVTRRQLWDSLDDSVRGRVAEWLEHHATRQAWPNNWVLFTAVIEAFLASIGRDTTDYRRDADVRWVESWHLGDGWYTDGQRRNIDYYNAWVIHPFLWAWYDMVGRDRDPDAAWRWRQRLAAFGESYPRLFGANGSPVQQGRSLTYRTAVLAPLWLGELTGTARLAPGAVRRLASGTLRYFVDAGVGADDPPGLGWTAADYLPLTQPYSGPGSPYFAGMGFLGLALPPDHPVWTAREEAQPTETSDGPVALPGAGWLVDSTPRDGVVRLFNHGSDHITPGTPHPDPLYSKLAYSTHTAPGMDAAFDAHADNEFVPLDPEPDHRRAIDQHRVDGRIAVSRNRYGTGSVVTASILWGEVELRCHLVEHGAVRAAEGGFLLADDVPPWAEAHGTRAVVRDGAGLTAVVIGLHGYTEATVSRFGAVNALGDHSAVPGLRAAEPARVFVAAHGLGRIDDVDEWWREMALPEISVAGTRVLIGAEPVVDLATALPPPRTRAE